MFLVGLSILVLSVQSTAYYYYQRDGHASPSSSQISCEQLDSQASSTASAARISVNVLISYGNATAQWYNKSNIPNSWSFYYLTLYDTNCRIQSQFFPTIDNEHLITSINGVQARGHYSWALWEYCDGNSAWSRSNVGADRISIRNGQTFGWAYQSSEEAPVNNAHVIPTCL